MTEPNYKKIVGWLVANVDYLEFGGKKDWWPVEEPNHWAFKKGLIKMVEAAMEREENPEDYEAKADEDQKEEGGLSGETTYVMFWTNTHYGRGTPHSPDWPKTSCDQIKGWIDMYDPKAREEGRVYGYCDEDYTFVVELPIEIARTVHEDEGSTLGYLPSSAKQLDPGEDLFSHWYEHYGCHG